ncbi:MAG: hypothetical protein ABJE63_11920 [Lentilitoribacter sp.]
MRRSLTILAVLIISTLISHAATSGLQGLYYPPGDTTGSWTCSADNLGEYGGALGVENDILYGTEWSCQLSSPKQTDDGTQFFGECSAEGTDYRDIITLRQTANGLNVKTEDGELEWRSCSKQSPTTSSTQPKSNWSSQNHADGTVEYTLSNQTDDQLLFSCKDGDVGSILIMLSSQELYGGDIDLTIDGNDYSMVTWADSFEINTECRVCAENKLALIEDIRSGQQMTVIANGNKPIQFDITGATEIFDGGACFADDKVFEETKNEIVDCKFVADFKIMHWGQCRIEEDDTSISFYTINNPFFIPIHFHEDESNATGYWNGSNGGNHAHANLGEMQLIDNCWRNDRNSICIGN